MPAAPHSLTLGIASDTFPVVAGGVYAWHAQVRAEGFTGTQGAVDYGVQVLVVQNGCNTTEDKHCGASLPYGRFSLQRWVVLSGTFLADEQSDGDVYVQAWVDGNYTGTFFLADVRIVQLNTALLNVVRTPLTDINVTSADGAVQYQIGVDFNVTSPARKNVAGAQDLVEVFEEGEDPPAPPLQQQQQQQRGLVYCYLLPLLCFMTPNHARWGKRVLLWSRVQGVS